MYKVLVVLTALTALVRCYDYRDEIYNQLIKQQLDDLDTTWNNRVYNHRAKRDEEASTLPSGADKCNKKRKYRVCCGEEMVEAMIEKDKDLKRECYKRVVNVNKEDKPMSPYDPFNCDRINKTKKEWSCVMECVGQKKGIIDEHGDIKAEDYLQYYQTELGKEEWFNKMIVDVFPKCIAQIRNTTKFVKKEGDRLSCNSAGVKMHHCMWRELQLHCPEDKISDQKACQKIKDKMKKQEHSDKHASHAHDDDHDHDHDHDHDSDDNEH